MGEQEMYDEISTEIKLQDKIHPSGYPPTRDGIRLGIQTVVDEMDEAFEEWRAGRCKCPDSLCDHHDWSVVREETIQAVAVALRMVRSIDQSLPEWRNK